MLGQHHVGVPRERRHRDELGVTLFEDGEIGHNTEVIKEQHGHLAFHHMDIFDLFWARMEMGLHVGVAHDEVHNAIKFVSGVVQDFRITAARRCGGLAQTGIGFLSGQ